MQDFLYFCSVKSLLAVILLVVNFSLDDIIGDIYHYLTEIGEVDYEQLQTELWGRDHLQKQHSRL